MKLALYSLNLDYRLAPQRLKVLTNGEVGAEATRRCTRVTVACVRAALLMTASKRRDWRSPRAA